MNPCDIYFSLSMMFKCLLDPIMSWKSSTFLQYINSLAITCQIAEPSHLGFLFLLSFVFCFLFF